MQCSGKGVERCLVTWMEVFLFILGGLGAQATVLFLDVVGFAQVDSPQKEMRLNT